MSDPRSTPDPTLVDTSEPAQISVAISDLMRSPLGARDRQLLFGDRVTVLHRREGWALIRSDKDGYCGWVMSAALGPFRTVTHRVTARATHVYSAADFKSSEVTSLSFGSGLTALSETATFIETSLGYVPRQHVHAADAHATDPAAIAEIFLGTPYLWGGNSSFGIDCSGLVQAACLACNIPCAGDTDQQQTMVGTALAKDTVLRRNDVIFWKGHVALVSDADTIIHANAGYMSTVFEPLADALARIETQGDGRPTAFTRLL